MRIIIFFLFLYSINIFHIVIKSQESKLILTNINNGVYNIILRQKLTSLTYIGGLKSSKEKFGNSRLNFRISKIEENEKKDNNNDNNDTDRKYFTIRHIYSNNLIGVIIDKDHYPIIGTEKMIDYASLSFEWEFIEIEEKIFLIRNKVGCFLKEEKNIFFCTEDKYPPIVFYLIKIYTEIKHTNEDLEIIEKEPIDVFIKYIDLHDPNLVREEIPQISKDIDNEELRYCIRSILKNIPWVRKIFILMPNEKVRYFKDYEFINEKIVYVKDKDLLGYDSADSHAFQYRIWKMKEFGLSDNFIIMDDDYFIGQPLNKSDFFYVENNTVLPAIINTNYEIITYNLAKKELYNLKKKINESQRLQTSDMFMHSVYKAYIFLIEYFNSPITVPYFTHNAIPANINDIKEIYDLIYNSEHKNNTLYSLYRHNETLQFQTSLIVYTFNKYNRKSNIIQSNYIDNSKTVEGNYNYPLFCINTGNNYDYSNISFIKTKIVMEGLFPTPTKYEIYDNTIVPNNIVIILTLLQKELSELKKQKEAEDIDKEKYENEKISQEFLKCENQVEMIQAKNDAFTTVINKTNMEINNCTENNEYLSKERNELIIGNKKGSILVEISRIKIKNKNNIKKIKELKNENEQYLKVKKALKNNQKEIYFIIYFELGFIILLAFIIISYIRIKRKNNNINYNNSNINFIPLSKQLNGKENKLFDEI